MASRGQELAQRFEQANEEMIRAVEGCSDEQWRAKCAGEGWSVGVVAHHVAGGHQGIAGLVNAVATGQPVPSITMEQIDQGNAQHAQQHANCTKQETLDMLRQNGEAAAGTVRGLSDEQLSRTAPLLGGPPMSAGQMVERILIGHVQGHLDSIKQATAS
jgi:uncharacterized damage-inducible protein DinB